MKNSHFLEREFFLFVTKAKVYHQLLGRIKKYVYNDDMQSAALTNRQVKYSKKVINT